MKKIAVITGASSGMGREFVYAIDKDSELDELWVIEPRFFICRSVCIPPMLLAL